MKISFVIPTINQIDMVDKCLSTLRQFNKDVHEIIVIDDGSNDQTKEAVSAICVKHEAVFLSNYRNVGFSNTVNRGIDLASGDIAVLVNNDIVFTTDITEELSRVFALDPLIGIVGGLLMYPHGTIQHGGVVRVGTNFTHRGWHKNLHDSPEVSVPSYLLCVTGALYAIRKTMTNRIGVMNPKYFLACEDTELCLRAWNIGWRVYYSPKVTAIHAEGGTRGNTQETKMKVGREWLVKENETGRLFREDLKSFNLDALDEKVRFSNGEQERKKLSSIKETSGVIGVNRRAALGDVLLTTGIIRALKQRYPNHDIHVSTLITEIFKNNPYVSKVVTDKSQLVANIMIDLDMVYEKNPKMSVIDAYGREAFGDQSGLDLRPELFSCEADKHRVMTKIPPDFWNSRYVVVHMAVSWQNRTWQRQKWLKVIEMCVRNNERVVVVGRGGDFLPDPMPGVFNAINALNLAETRELIKHAKCFVSMDSGILHVAMTTETPVVGLFTCANPEYRLFPRGAKTVALIPKVSCRFCLHEENPPVTFVGCKVNTFQCLNDITYQDVVAAIHGCIHG